MGFAFRMDIENRLRTLFAVRKNILDLFGGEMPILQTGESAEANLNEAVSMWIIFGPKNRGEFYKWLEEKGYKRESKQTSGEYAWVLVDVLDFENADEWERADAHEAYACTYSYARGSYSASTTYEGYDTYGEGKKGTLGALAVYSGMPDIIYPDKPVTLKLSFTTTQNDVVKLYFTANTSAWFDLWDMASGVTGGARDFVNADGKSSFNIKSLEGPSSYSETLTATLGQGSEGERIALILKLSLGASMRTNYVYEWKQVG